MRKFTLLLLVASVFASCSPSLYTGAGNRYKYTYTKEDQSKDLRFEDDKLDFKFDITNKEVNFTARNKTNEPLKILWDEASLVIEGKANKVMHKGIKYADRNSTQPPSVIPPMAIMDDMIVPTDNVDYREGVYTRYYSSAGGWETKDLFLTYDLGKQTARDLIQNTKGQKMSLYLPVMNTEGKTQHYNFVFVVDEVVCTSCKGNTAPAPATKRPTKMRG